VKFDLWYTRAKRSGAVRASHALGAGRARVLDLHGRGPAGQGRFTDDPKGRGPARWRRTVRGSANPRHAVQRQVDRDRASFAASARGPFITSHVAAGRVEPRWASARSAPCGPPSSSMKVSMFRRGPGRPHHLHAYRLDAPLGRCAAMARDYIGKSFGDQVPARRSRTSSRQSNKGAQEAHEAIRPTNAQLPAERASQVRSSPTSSASTADLEPLCRLPDGPAEWDATTVLLSAGGGANQPTLTFRATRAHAGVRRLLQGRGRSPRRRRPQTLPPLKRGPGAEPAGRARGAEVHVARRRVTPRPRSSRRSKKEGIGRPDLRRRSSRRDPGPQVRRAARSVASTRPTWARSSPTSSSRPFPRSWTSDTRARWNRSRQDRGGPPRLDQDAPGLLRPLHRRALENALRTNSPTPRPRSSPRPRSTAAPSAAPTCVPIRQERALPVLLAASPTAITPAH
jgi:hypothetical protein